MQFNKKGKKDFEASRNESLNISNHSGINVDSYTMGREITGRNIELSKSTTESGYKEVLYLDANDRRLQNMSPGAVGGQTISFNYRPVDRSPVSQYGRSSVISSVKHDLNERADTASLVGKKPITNLRLEMPVRKEGEEFERNRGERSPHVISLARNPGEPEESYGNKNLYQRQSPRENIKSSYNYINSNYANDQENEGNLLVDQPINSLGSFEHDDFQNAKVNNRGDPREKSREILFTNSSNYIDKPLENKMSPNRNSNGFESLGKIQDSPSNLKQKKLDKIRRLSKAIKNNIQEEIYSKNSHETRESFFKNYKKDIDNLIQMKDDEIISPRQLKMFQRKYTVGYNKNKKEGALLTKQSNLIGPIVDSNEIFPDRQTILKRMNKLSHILKSRSVDPLEKSTDQDEMYLNSRATTIRDARSQGAPLKEDIRKTNVGSRSPAQSKFIRVSMAMLSSKGPNCEDRVITRVMRVEKGGVVDLHQNKKKTNNKYQIKKVGRQGEKPTAQQAKRYGPKDKEKASKIVQAWWREILNKYKSLNDKILKIQKVWRGHFLRNYVYDILSSSIITQLFIDNVKKPLVTEARMIGFNALYPFAKLFFARKNLKSILNIQSKAKTFLNRLRNKRSKMGLLLDKFFLRRKKGAFDQINHHANDLGLRELKKLKLSLDFLQKVKKIMRVRIFHNFLTEAYNRPINQLKTVIFYNMLRGNIRKFKKIILREWYMRWMKRSLIRKQTPEYLVRLANPLIRTIMKFRLRDLLNSLKTSAKLDKVKSKLLKRMIGNAGKYKLFFLNMFWKKWLTYNRDHAEKEFAKKVSSKLTVKYLKKAEKYNLLRRFKLWRLGALSKKNLLPFVNGSEVLKKHCLRKVFNKVMPINSVEGIKNRSTTNIIKKSGKFKKIPLRHYYNKWKNFISLCRRSDLAAKLVKSMGSKQFKFMCLKMLGNKFQRWKLKVKQHEYLDIQEEEREKKERNKYYENLSQTLRSVPRKFALKDTIPNIAKYATEITISEGAKKIMQLHPKLNRLLMKRYWINWAEKAKKLTLKDMKNRLFFFIAKGLESKVTGRYLKRYFGKWQKTAPKDAIIKHHQAADSLLNKLRKKYLGDIINSFKIKIDEANVKDGISKAFNVKNKFILRHWREYLLKWRKISGKLASKALQNDIAVKLMNKFVLSRRNHLLRRSLIKWWKTKPKVEDVILRYKGLGDMIDKSVNKNLKVPAKTFFNNFKKHTGEFAKRKAMRLFADYAVNGQNKKLGQWFDKWRFKILNIEIHQLKTKILRISVGQQQIKTNKLTLSSAFYKWMEKKNIDKHSLNREKSFSIYKGGDILDKLKRRRINNFIIRLHRLMDRDPRGKFYLNMFKRLLKPRVSLHESFDRWRRVKDNMQKLDETNNLKADLINKSCKKVAKRKQRDDLSRAFNKFKILLRKPNDYYGNIVEGSNKTLTFLKSKLKPSFRELADHKNYQKFFLRILPMNLKMKARSDKNSIIKSWNKLKNNVTNEQKKDFRDTIFKKMGKNLTKRRNLNQLAFGFHKWWNYKRPSTNFPNVVKGSDIILDNLQKRFRKPIIDQMTKNRDEKVKKGGIFLLFSKSKTFNKSKLHKFINLWWKKSLYKDDELKSKALRTIKRYIVQNHIMGPLEKYFRRWLKNMITKPQDFKSIRDGTDKLKSGILKKHLGENFIKKLGNKISPEYINNKIIDNLLPNVKSGNKRNLHHYLNKWKKKADAIEAKEVKARLLNSIYGNGKTALKKRWLKIYFSKWNKKPKEKPKLDLINVVRGENIIFKTLANKYMKGFLPKAKEEMNNRFLKGLLKKNSKYHRKALHPFFLRWKDTANKLKTNEIEADLLSRYMLKIKKSINSRALKEILKKKLDQWRNNNKQISEDQLKAIPNLLDILRKQQIKKIFPFLSTGMKKGKLKSTKPLNKTAARLLMEFKKKYLLADLYRAYMKLKDNSKNDKLDEMRHNMMRKYLKGFSKNYNKNRLQKAFYVWMGKQPKNLTAVKVGVMALSNLLARRPFNKLMKKAKQMPAKLGDDSSLKNALMKSNPSLAKTLCINHILIRPYLKLWLSKSRYFKNQDIKEDIFKKIMMPNFRNKGRVMTRHYFKKWRNVINEEDKLNAERNFTLKISRGILEKNGKLFLIRKFNLWRDLNRKENQKLYNISKGVSKLKNRMNRHAFHNLSSKLLELKDGKSKFLLAKKMMINTFRNNDKGNLVFCFRKWLKNKNDERERNLKQKVLQAILRKKIGNSDENDNNLLHECILRWRILAPPKDYYDTMNRYRVGYHTLHRGLTKKFNDLILNKLKSAARMNKIKTLMYEIISDYDKEANKYVLKNRFKFWRQRLGDKDILTKRFRHLSNEYIKNQSGELIKKPISDLVESMKAWAEMKKNKASTIQDYCKNLLLILQRMKAVQRNRNMHKIFSSLSLKDSIKIRLLFARWMKNANLVGVEDKARLIQKFLRGKKDALTVKRGKINDGLEHVDKYVKLKSMKKINSHGKERRKRQLLVRLLPDIPKELKKEFLNKYLNRWRKINLRAKEEAASHLISRVLKGFLTRKFKNLLLKRKAKVNEITIKLFGKHLDKTKLYFNKWLLDTRKNIISQAGEVIDAFLRPKLLNLKKARAVIRLYELLKHSYVNNIAKLIKKASLINGDRGLIMYDTLKNIYIERPFKKVQEGSMWIGRLKRLHNVYPMITEALRKYWLPHYMRKWKERTYDDKIRRIIQVQNWYKSRMLIWKAKCELRKINLTQKYMSKMTKDNTLKLKLSIRLWNKFGKFSQLNKTASAVQTLWRGNTARKTTDRLLNCKKMKNIFRKTLLRSINKTIIKCADFTEPLKRNLKLIKSGIEKRYPTNNFMTVANDRLRTALVNRLAKNADKAEYDYNIRRAFNRLKIINKLANDAALKTQSKFRQFRALKKRLLIQRIRDKMKNVFLRYDKTELGKLKSAMHLWNSNATALKLNEKAKVIQDYTRKNLAKKFNSKFKNFFKNNFEKIVKSRLNKAGKLKKLKDTVQKTAIRPVVEKLIFNKKRGKIASIFINKFKDLDEQMRALYLKKFLIDWRDKAKILRNREISAAVAIISLFKGNLVRRFLAKLREKQNKLRFMMLKLTKDKTVQMQIILRLWFNKSRSLKLTDSAIKIQDYLKDVKDKMDKIKLNKKNKKYTDAYDALAHGILPKIMAKTVLNKIKSEANRKLLKKVADNVENKKRDHLITAFDAISKRAFNVFALRNKGAKLIQDKFHLLKKRKGIWGVISKIRKLRFILKLMGDRNTRMLNKTFRIWRRNALGDKFTEAANTIQNFLDNKVLKYRKGKKESANENLYRILRTYLVNNQLRPFFKNFANTIKLNRFKLSLMKYIFNKFRKNIDQSNKNECFDGMLNLRKKYCERILHKRFLEWGRRAKLIQQKAAANKLINSIRRYILRIRLRLLNYKTRNIMARLAAKHMDIRKLALNLWNRITQKIKMEANAKIIQDFVSNNLDRQKAKKKWLHLANKLHSRHRFTSGINIFERYKKFKGIGKLFDFINGKMIKGGFNLLRKNIKKERIINHIKLIFSGFEQRKENLSKLFYFKRWRTNKSKIENKEEKVKNLVDIIGLRSKKDGLNVMGNAMKFKNLLILIDTIRGKIALKKIKKRATNNDKVKIFGQNLIKAEEELALKNTDLFANKVFKIYIYKIMCNLSKILNKYISKAGLGKTFFKNLVKKAVEDSKHSYNKDSQCKTVFKPKELAFKAQVHNPKKLHSVLSKKQPTDYLAPMVSRMYKSLLNKRLNWAWENLKGFRRSGKLYGSLQKIIGRFMMNPKKSFFIRLNKLANYNEQTPQKVANLFKLFRRYFLARFTKDLHPINRNHKAMGLVRLIFMSRDLSSKRFLRELVRRWRFLIYMKKLAKQKLEAMYKNMHINYLNMAKEVFGDGDGEYGMITEFEKFGSSIGMFTNVDIDEYEEGKKKLSSQFTKKFVIEAKESIPYDGNEESHYDEFSIVRDRNSLLGDNTEYYYDEGIGDATQGRYKVDTNKSQGNIENLSKDEASRKKKK